MSPGFTMALCLLLLSTGAVLALLGELEFAAVSLGLAAVLWP